MSAPDRPEEYRKVWDSKPVLRAVYSDFYRRIAERLVEGPTLEIGGGSGNLKAFAPDVISSDIVPAPWLDLVCDAQAIPVGNETLSNIVMVDVLHHVERPIRFLNEAARTLRAGGRLVLCEPAITAVSYPFYRWFHPEPVDMRADPFADGPLNPDRDPWDANQAIPTLMFHKNRDALAAALPALHVTAADRFSFLAYPASGGFRPWSLMPAAIAKGLLKAEWSIRRLWGPIGAFRTLVTIEKRRS